MHGHSLWYIGLAVEGLNEQRSVGSWGNGQAPWRGLSQAQNHYHLPHKHASMVDSNSWPWSVETGCSGHKLSMCSASNDAQLDADFTMASLDCTLTQGYEPLPNSSAVYGAEGPSSWSRTWEPTSSCHMPVGLWWWGKLLTVEVFSIMHYSNINIYSIWLISLVSLNIWIV